MILVGCSTPLIIDNGTLYVGFNDYKKDNICPSVTHSEIKNFGLQIGNNTGVGYIDKKQVSVNLENVKKPFLCKTPLTTFILGVEK